MPSTTQNEAFSRILIDKALEESGWNLLDAQQVRFEYHTGGGRSNLCCNPFSKGFNNRHQSDQTRT